MPRWRWSCSYQSVLRLTIARWKRSTRISVNAIARCWMRMPACCRTISSTGGHYVRILNDLAQLQCKEQWP